MNAAGSIGLTVGWRQSYIKPKYVVLRFNGTSLNHELKSVMMALDHDTEKAVRRYLALLGDHYNMAGAIVYGSRAQGHIAPTATPMLPCS